VDLTRQKIHTKPLTDDLRGEFLGSRGVNAKLIWDLMRPDTDCFGPDNVLIFGAGTLTGTNAPCSGRTTVTCKGAETNLYLKGSMGGHWGAELKFAGYDHLVFLGVSQKPVCLWIDNERVEIRDATNLWGKNVEETDKVLKEELGDEDIKIACIGPAGENLVRFAMIMSCVHHAAGRGGAGAVMGSKRLKAIAVRGEGDIRVKEPERFGLVVGAVREALAADNTAKSMYVYGTSGGLAFTNSLGRLPCYNFRLGQLENVYPITGQCLVEQRYLKRRIGCFGCTISCHRYSMVESGPYSGTGCGGPEYESFASLGADTGVIDTQAVIKANQLCNDFGLDTISTGSVIAWAMECFEKGVIAKTDTRGLELNFGSAEALLTMVPLIARRADSIGNLLAEGVKRAAEKLGKDSRKWAICNSKGLEQSMVETRCSKGYALAFAVNPRGPDHLHACPWAERGSSTEAIALVEKLTGNRKCASPYLTEYRPEIVRWHEDCYAVTDSLGFCMIASLTSYSINPKNMAKMFSFATGHPMDDSEIMLAGRRILTLEKCFNVREGADRKLDDLPWRLMNEPAPTGPGKGLVNSKEELDKMLDKYYLLHGWDQRSGTPTRETLGMLGLKDVADELRKLGKLPAH